MGTFLRWSPAGWHDMIVQVHKLLKLWKQLQLPELLAELASSMKAATAAAAAPAQAKKGGARALRGGKQGLLAVQRLVAGGVSCLHRLAAALRMQEARRQQMSSSASSRLPAGGGAAACAAQGGSDPFSAARTRLLCALLPDSCRHPGARAGAHIPRCRTAGTARRIRKRWWEARPDEAKITAVNTDQRLQA